MNKAADFLAGHTPWEIFTRASLLGAGGFGAAQLLKNITSDPESDIMKQQEGLNIPMPAPKVEPVEGQPVQDQQHAQLPQTGSRVARLLGLHSHKEKQAEDNTIMKLLALSGVPLGFLGANAVYKNYRTNQVQGDIDEENKKRLQLMQQVKVSQATPLVDAMCEGIAKQLAKEGGFVGDMWDRAKTTASGMLGDVTGGHFGNSEGLTRLTDQDDSAVGSHASKMFGGDTVLNGMGLMAALVAGGTGYTMYDAYQKKKDSEKSHQYPDKVNIQPTPV